MDGLDSGGRPKLNVRLMTGVDFEPTMTLCLLLLRPLLVEEVEEESGATWWCCFRCCRMNGMILEDLCCWLDFRDLIFQRIKNINICTPRTHHTSPIAHMTRHTTCHTTMSSRNNL